MDEMDEDGGGEVDFEEFSAWLNSSSEIAQKVKTEIVKVRLNTRVVYLPRCRSNGSMLTPPRFFWQGVMGEQTNAERDAKAKLSVAEAYEDMASTLFTLLDRNGDGELDPAEISKLGVVAELDDLTADDANTTRTELLELSDGEFIDLEAVTQWLQSESQVAKGLTLQSPLGQFLRGAIAKETRKNRKKQGVGKLGKLMGKKEDPVLEQAMRFWEAVDEEFLGSIVIGDGTFTHTLEDATGVELNKEDVTKALDPDGTGFVDEETFTSWYMSPECTIPALIEEKEATSKLVEICGAAMLKMYPAGEGIHMTQAALASLKVYGMDPTAIKTAEDQLMGTIVGGAANGISQEALVKWLGGESSMAPVVKAKLEAGPVTASDEGGGLLGMIGIGGKKRSKAQQTEYDAFKLIDVTGTGSIAPADLAGLPEVLELDFDEHELEDLTEVSPNDHPRGGAHAIRSLSIHSLSNHNHADATWVGCHRSCTARSTLTCGASGYIATLWCLPRSRTRFTPTPVRRPTVPSLRSSRPSW